METKMEKKKANRKPLIIIAVAVLLLLAVGGTYVINGLSHNPEVFRRILTETAEEDAYTLFEGGYAGTPLLSIYQRDDNLLDSEGNPITYEDLWSSSTKLCLYQAKANDMLNDIDEYRIGDIVINESDPSFGGLTTADVTFVFKWYDLDPVTDEYNKLAYNELLPYIIAGSEREKLFQVIDNLMLSILERVEDTGMTREYEAVDRYYLSVGGSNGITGEGSHWNLIGQKGDAIREMILEKLNIVDHAEDDPTDEELAERKEIVMNMAIAVEMYGKDGTKQLLEDLGYDGLVAKMIAEDVPEESNDS